MQCGLVTLFLRVPLASGTLRKPALRGILSLNLNRKLFTLLFFTPAELSNHPPLGPLEGADGQEEGLRHRRQREVLYQLQL